MTCITKALPVAETEVRLYCKTSTGNFYVCTGFYIPLGLKEDDSQYCWDDECIIYDEDENCNYVDPGWYERIYNWPDYGAVKIYDEVLDWSPLEQVPLRWRPKINEVVRVKQVLSGGNFLAGEKVRIIGVFLNEDTFQAVPVDRPQDIFPYCLTIDEIEPLETKWERTPSRENKTNIQKGEKSKILIRVTSNRSWEKVQKDLANEMGYSHLWKRLNQIENILGSGYSLEELEQVWKNRNKGGQGGL